MERMGSFRFTEHLGKMHCFPVFSEVEDCFLLPHLPSQFPSWGLAGVAHHHCKQARSMFQDCLHQPAFSWGCMNAFWHCGRVELESWASCLSLHLWPLVQCVIWKSGSQDFSFEQTWSDLVLGEHPQKGGRKSYRKETQFTSAVLPFSDC